MMGRERERNEIIKGKEREIKREEIHKGNDISKNKMQSRMKET